MIEELKFTGERVVPDETPYSVWQEHLARYEFATKFIKGKVVLDIACGTGYGSEYMLRRGARKVIGVDISAEAINYAKRHYSREMLFFIESNATMLPFNNNSFDVIISFETIEHIKEYENFIQEVSRVLKNEGIFICSTPNKRVSSPHSEIPLNPYHVREFYAIEFACLLKKYFSGVSLYGQNNINLLCYKLKQIIYNNLLNLYNNHYLIGHLIRIKRLFSKHKINQSIDAIEDRFLVRNFYDNLFRCSSYIIAICYK